MSELPKHLIEYSPIPDVPELGPAMRKLLPQQRAFVLAFVDLGGGRKGSEAARKSGYGGANPHSVRIQAWRLLHDSDVLTAIKEVAEKRISANAALAADIFLEIAQDPTHKDRFKAAEKLAALSGIVVVERKEVAHTHKLDDKAAIQKIVDLARRMNMDPAALLGNRYVEAEFVPVTVVPALTDDREPAMSSEGLEDLL